MPFHPRDPLAKPLEGLPDGAAVKRRAIELVPQVAVLETGTLAKEFEASVKAARFVDRRG